MKGTPRRLPCFLSIPDQQALAVQWQWLAHGLWKSWAKHHPLIARLGMDDAISAGQIGLMEACKRFDPSRGIKFSTYATWWIRQRMAREAMNCALLVRLPIHIYKRKPARRETVQARDQALAPIGQLDFEGQIMPDTAAAKETNAQIAARVGELPERDQVILRLRFWENQTLLQVGQQLGLTRERVRQIQKRALDELRTKLAA